MKDHQKPIGFILRPTVAFLIPYLSLCSLWFLYILLFTNLPTDGPLQLISRSQFIWATVANLCWIIALVIDTVRWRSWHVSVRRGQLASVVLAFLAVLLLQIGFVLAHDPFMLD